VGAFFEQFVDQFWSDGHVVVPFLSSSSSLACVDYLHKIFYTLLPGDTHLPVDMPGLVSVPLSSLTLLKFVINYNGCSALSSHAGWGIFSSY
ncbi:MAG: hypothetical protein M3Y81_24695, partial [Chloroflexota bacterium]|nr:hypothetical protein [Chloroflexota bacterium]